MFNTSFVVHSGLRNKKIYIPHISNKISGCDFDKLFALENKTKQGPVCLILKPSLHQGQGCSPCFSTSQKRSLLAFQVQYLNCTFNGKALGFHLSTKIIIPRIMKQNNIELDEFIDARLDGCDDTHPPNP